MLRDKRLSKSTSSRAKPREILLPVLDGQGADDLIPIGRALSDDSQVRLLGLVAVDRERSLSEGARSARKHRAYLTGLASDQKVRLWPKIVVSYDPALEVSAFAAERNIDLLVLGWDQDAQLLSEVACQGLLQHCCNLAVAKGPLPQPGAGILVVLRPGRDSELALRLALRAAEYLGSTVTAIRVAEEALNETELRSAQALDQVLEHLPQVEDAILLADNPHEAVLEQAQDFELVIAGARADDDTQLGERSFDPLSLALLDRAPGTTLITQTRQEPDSTPLQVAGLETISILVDKWFAENTFHSNEFADLQRLMALKERQALTISLALPALNEEKTVGNVIRTLQSSLMTDIPLLDEMILIDSNSSDRTREIAADLGIPVFIHQEVLTPYGSRVGKGEALWKSLYLTQGDIVLWIDTDIVNIHPRFVYGLIGPLLLRPDLVFVKGYYVRPIRVQGKLHTHGGGRVTELMARPLLNLFFPALSGLIQPLSGEYGGRRNALEKLSFSSGYGVETALLIEILEQFGLGAIGQVDLVRRVHHNQPLTALSKMSFAIIQTIVRYIDQRYDLAMLSDINRTMKLIHQQRGRFYLQVEEIAERERPPMITLEEYQARFHNREAQQAAHG